jgi:hypothetical protein
MKCRVQSSVTRILIGQCTFFTSFWPIKYLWTGCEVRKYLYNLRLGYFKVLSKWLLCPSMKIINWEIEKLLTYLRYGHGHIMTEKSFFLEKVLLKNKFFFNEINYDSFSSVLTNLINDIVSLRKKDHFSKKICHIIHVKKSYNKCQQLTLLHIPVIVENPVDLFLSFSFEPWWWWWWWWCTGPKSRLAGVTSIPAFKGENSSIPTPLWRKSSSDVSSNDIETVGPGSTLRRILRTRLGRKW